MFRESLNGVSLCIIIISNNLGDVPFIGTESFFVLLDGHNFITDSDISQAFAAFFELQQFHLVGVIVLEAEDLLIIGSQVVMFDVLLFNFQKWLSNFVQVIEQALSLDIVVKFCMFSFKSSPLCLSNDVSTAMSMCLVNEVASLIKASVEASNDCLSWVSHFQMNSFIDFVTDIIKALFNENNFIHIIKLLENKGTSSILNWLKSLQNINHEVLILKVVPRIKTMFSTSMLVWNIEEPLEIIEESHEKEIRVNHSSDVNWKLIKQTLIFFFRDALVLIVAPSVIKEVFYLHFQIKLDILTLVKLLDETKEFG